MNLTSGIDKIKEDIKSFKNDTKYLPYNPLSKIPNN